MALGELLERFAGPLIAKIVRRQLGGRAAGFESRRSRGPPRRDPLQAPPLPRLDSHRRARAAGELSRLRRGLGVQRRGRVSDGPRAGADAAARPRALRSPPRPAPRGVERARPRAGVRSRDRVAAEAPAEGLGPSARPRRPGRDRDRHRVGRVPSPHRCCSIVWPCRAVSRSWSTRSPSGWGSSTAPRSRCTATTMPTTRRQSPTRSMPPRRPSASSTSGRSSSRSGGDSRAAGPSALRAPREPARRGRRGPGRRPGRVPRGRAVGVGSLLG